MRHCNYTQNSPSAPKRKLQDNNLMANKTPRIAEEAKSKAVVPIETDDESQDQDD